MRCDCCDKTLSDYEATLKHAVSGIFLNTCKKCLEGLNIPTKGRYQLPEPLNLEEEAREMADVTWFYEQVEDNE